jgi:hypothetical protein
MTGRELVVYGASLMDAALATAIGYRTAPMSKTERANFFNDRGPAGTFSAKIELAYAFRLISSETKSQCHMVRKVRNSFAHSVTVVDFADPECKKFVDGFTLVDPAAIVYPESHSGRISETSMHGTFEFDGETFPWEWLSIMVDSTDQLAFFTPRPVEGASLTLDDRVRHQIWSCIQAIVAPVLLEWHKDPEMKSVALT